MAIGGSRAPEQAGPTVESQSPTEPERVPSRGDSIDPLATTKITPPPLDPVDPNKEHEILHPGSQVGRYLIIQCIGSGSMGRVYSAYDPELDRKIALKLMHAQGIDAPEDTIPLQSSPGKRLLQEAKALSQLAHPNVVAVHDVGTLRDQVFIALELVTGTDLAQWAKAQRRSWREVLNVYIQAGRGLAAAHSVGLVHRDFKPQNAILGADGRVRVLDFGLAISSGAPGQPAAGTLARVLPDPEKSPDMASGRQFFSGTAVGTPAFMAPEVITGNPADEKSDQFSFCVSLYQALFGCRPFPGTSLPELLAAMRTGVLNEPENTRVPGWLKKAVLRGLADQSDARHPSMQALLDVLERKDPASQQRRWLVHGAVTMVLTVVVGAVALGGWIRSGAFSDPCAPTGRELTDVWDKGVKTKVQAAFMGTQRPYASDTTARVVDRLDRYAMEWKQMSMAVCRANMDSKANRSLVALREHCLARRRSQMKALTNLFARWPDTEVLDKAAQAAEGLYPVSDCADEKALVARVPPPEDPNVRSVVNTLESRVDGLEALFSAGKYKQAVSEGDALVAEVAGIPYGPLQARALLILGQTNARVSNLDRARVLLRDATIKASIARDDVLATRALAQMLYVVGFLQQRVADATPLIEWADVIVGRNEDDVATASWLNSKGLVLQRMGRFEDAIRSHEQALAIRERVLGGRSPVTAQSMNNLGSVLLEMGRFAEANALYARTLVTQEETLGPNHPELSLVLNNLGLGLHCVGRDEEAARYYQRAVDIVERNMGPQHPNVALPLNNLASVLLSQGRYAEAKEMYQRVLDMWLKTLGPQHPDCAYPLAGMGRAKLHLDDLAGAAENLQRALTVRERALGATHGDLVEPLLGLGELHLWKGRPAEAVGVLERALALEGAYLKPDVKLALADALWALGRDKQRALTLVKEAGLEAERIKHQPLRSRTHAWLAAHAVSNGEKK